MMKLPIMGITCDLKNYCFSCVVKSVPRDSEGKNVGYHCKICKIDILCLAGVGRQYDKQTGEIMDVCPKCRNKLEKGSYSLITKIQKGYRSFPEDTTVNSPLKMSALMEVPDWVFWAKPGDIIELNANISPCIGNKQLTCLLVVLDSESCFTRDSKRQKSYNDFSFDEILIPPLKLNAIMEMPDWVFWAKPGDIVEIKADISPCIGNKQLTCLVVVLNSESCFSNERV